MSKTLDKIRKLSREAAEKKLSEAQRVVQESVNRDSEVLETILALVKERLIYKEVVGSSRKKDYIVVTEDTVLEDYSHPASEYNKSTNIEKVHSGYYSYEHTNIRVGGHQYYHAADLIGRYKYEANRVMEKAEREYDIARERKEAIDNLEALEPTIKNLMLSYQKYLANAADEEDD